MFLSITRLALNKCSSILRFVPKPWCSSGWARPNSSSMRPRIQYASNKACFPRAFRMSLQPRLLGGIRGSVNTERIQESAMRKHGCCSPIKECCIMRRNRWENWSWTSRTGIAQTNASVSITAGSHFVIVNPAIAWPQGLGYKTYGRRQHDANHRVRSGQLACPDGSPVLGRKQLYTKRNTTCP